MLYSRNSRDAIDVVECHGTGTALGDPIEVGALMGVLRKHKDAPPLVLAAVKTNIGHTENASGTSGIIKCIIELMHSSVSPNIHLRVLNTHLDRPSHNDFDSFEFPNEIIALAESASIYGVVNAFGRGGCNATALINVTKSAFISNQQALIS